MEKKECLVDLYKRALKAADTAAKDVAGHEPSAAETRCIDALRKLQTLPVDIKILAETQAARNLRRLAKHPRKKIQAVAVDLIATWKNKCLEKSDNKLTSSTPIVLSRKKVEQGSSHAKPANLVIKLGSSRTVLKRKEAEPAADHSPPPAKAAKHAEPSSRTPSCNDQAREKVRSQIREALCRVSIEADDQTVQEKVRVCDPVRVAESIEAALFKKLGQLTEVGAHRAKYRSVMFNLKDGLNPDFRRRVLLGEVEADRVPELSSEEMASDKRRSEIEAIRVKALFKCGRAEKEATTDEFECGKCGLRKCRHESMQTRSADEPMTTYVMCVHCENIWKLG